MFIDLQKLSSREIYGLMVQTVIPRPIAWVLSDNGASWNLAPFSYFNAVASEPPLIMLSIGHKPGGEMKDTWRNIDERERFVVHIAGREHLDALVASSESLPHGESELDRLGLSLIEDPDAGCPRIAGCRVALFCRKFAIHELGPRPQALILGQIERMHLDDAVVAEVDGRLTIDAEAVDPVARLGGLDYALFGERISVALPG